MNEIQFDSDEMNKLAIMAGEEREHIVQRVLKAFPEGKGAEAVGVVLAILTASAFTSYPEQQHDQAQSFNQVFARWGQHPIGWRLTPIGVEGQHRR